MNVIREAREEDLSSLVSLFDEFLGDETRWFALSAQEESDLLDAIFENPPLLQSLVAEKDEVVVGYALWNWNYTAHYARPTLHLNALFVTKNARRCGIGSALFCEVVRHGIAHNCLRMEWRFPENHSFIKVASEVDAQTHLCRVSTFDLWRDGMDLIADNRDLAKQIFKQCEQNND